MYLLRCSLYCILPLIHLFHRIGSLGRFGLVVEMSVYSCIYIFICPLPMRFSQGRKGGPRGGGSNLNFFVALLPLGCRDSGNAHNSVKQICYQFLFWRQRTQQYWCYYPHRSRDTVSPVCGIFYNSYFQFNTRTFIIWRKYIYFFCIFKVIIMAIFNGFPSQHIAIVVPKTSNRSSCTWTILYYVMDTLISEWFCLAPCYSITFLKQVFECRKLSR